MDESYTIGGSITIVPIDKPAVERQRHTPNPPNRSGNSPAVPGAAAPSASTASSYGGVEDSFLLARGRPGSPESAESGHTPSDCEHRSQHAVARKGLYAS